MTSSENLSTLEAWTTFRPPFADSWLADATTDSLTKALQISLSNNVDGLSDTFVSDLIPPFVSAPETPTSNLSGSDQDVTVTVKRQRGPVPVSTSGKITKRKSRATKRTQTTFITADPANFRQMVQQVTGIRFGSSPMPVTPILKPEPQRLSSRLSGGGGVGCLPTLDTSAFLLDHHQQMGPVSGPVSGSSLVGGPFPFQGQLLGGGAEGGLEFDSFPNFPTLESWKVM